MPVSWLLLAGNTEKIYCLSLQQPIGNLLDRFFVCRLPKLDRAIFAVEHLGFLSVYDVDCRID
jgi:hypothetical protein